MLFRKKIMDPILTKYVKNNEKRIMKNHRHVITILYLILCKSVAENKHFGRDKKERKLLFNNVSIFELTSYVLYKLIKYCNINYKEKKLRKVIDYNDEMRFNLFEILKSNLYNTLQRDLEWEDIPLLFDNRIKFYFNLKNQDLKKKCFFTMIKKSINQSEPSKEISELDYDPLKIGIEELVYYSIQLKAYEETILETLYAAIDQFFSECPEFGY